MIVLIDSSAWIWILRKRQDSALAQEIESLLHAGQAALTAPVWLELYRGVKGRQEETRLQSLRELCVWLEFDAACWDAACQIARACLRSGTQVPTGDLLVYASARRHGARLLHRDSHFDQLDRIHPD